ncbi:MAG TPA: hypothetical protein VF666_03025 [Pyrinomonadaceae bacterium]|jgi:hypothetical protein
MNVTTEDYERAVHDFVADMHPLGDDVVSILLYGSVACKRINPGKSDLLDATVFLRDEVFQDKERFLKTLEIMVESCRRISRKGIPFHPFFYFSQAEASCYPAPYMSSWESEKTSQVLCGEDIRPRIRSRELSRAVTANAFFEGRRSMAHVLTVYLSREDWTPQDRLDIIHRLISLKKFMTIMACFALGISVEASRAVVELEKALPNLDTSVLKRIESFRNQTEPREELSDLRGLLREMLIFVENLHDRIIESRRTRL